MNLETWVQHELDGYDDAIPYYRKILGNALAWNPARGWIPIHSNNPDMMNAIRQAVIGESVASLRDLLDNNGDGSLQYQIPPHQLSILNKVMNFQTSQAIIQIGRGDIVSILDKVRNMVLDWAIEMERKGVLGQGMSFNNSEKVQAQNAMTSFNIGSIGNFSGNLGSGNSSGDISLTVSSIEHIKSVVEKVRHALPSLETAGVNTEHLESILGKIQAESETAKPRANILKSLFGDARSALSGAAGNLIAEGALALIHGALGVIGG